MSVVDTSNDAFATLKGLLNQYGLSSLADWAWGELVAGRSQNEITLALMDRPEFQQRFPAIAQRQAAGLPPISPAEYIAYERQAAQLMRAAGFPPGTYDTPEDFTKFISQDVSLGELSQRVQIYQQAAYQAPAEVRQLLRDMYGIDEGHIAAYFADPDRVLPLLQQRFTAAQIAGEAQRQQFGQLTTSEAERLAQAGVTDQQAGQAFGALKQGDELFRQLPGEATTAPGRADALGFVAGDAAAQQAVDLQARRRRAPFGDGGGFAGTQTGPTGLGSAATP